MVHGPWSMVRGPWSIVGRRIVNGYEHHLHSGPMTAKRKKIILLVLLLVVLVAAWTVMLRPAFLFDRGERRSSSLGGETDSIFEDDMIWLGMIARIRAMTREQVEYDPKGARDPMIISLDTHDSPEIEEIVESDDIPALELDGIIWDEREPVVMINREAFRENDMVEGVRILKIERHKAILFYRSKRFELELR